MNLFKECIKNFTYFLTFFWSRYIIWIVPRVHFSVIWMAGGFAVLQIAPTKTILSPRPVVAPDIIGTCHLTLCAAPLLIVLSINQIISIVSSVVFSTAWVSISVLNHQNEDYKCKEYYKSSHFARLSSIELLYQSSRPVKHCG